MDYPIRRHPNCENTGCGTCLDEFVAWVANGKKSITELEKAQDSIANLLDVNDALRQENAELKTRLS